MKGFVSPRLLRLSNGNVSKHGMTIDTIPYNHCLPDACPTREDSRTGSDVIGSVAKADFTHFTVADSQQAQRRGDVQRLVDHVLL